MRSFAVQVLLAVGLTCVLGLTCRAQPASYEDALEHAAQAYSLGHYTEARFFYARAHALQPNARTLRGLGLTCYASQSYVEAIAYFKQALAAPLGEELHEELTQRLAQAEQLVTRVHLTLEPSDAELEVDHEARALTDGVLLLDPGTHQLSASAAGHRSVQQLILAAGGEPRVALRLTPTAATPVAASPPVSSGGSDLAPYIVIAAGGAAFVAGAVFVGIAAADKDAVESAGQGVSWRELEPRYHRGRTFFPVGFALMGVGFAGAAAGLTWKLWPSQREHAGLRVSPLGVELKGRF